jgi:hypothetical protein
MKERTCACGFLEEINGFETPGEYERFRKYIDEQVAGGALIKVEADSNYEKGLIYGGEWFKCTTCNETWRMIPPDFPFRGLWEKIE